MSWLWLHVPLAPLNENVPRMMASVADLLPSHSPSLRMLAVCHADSHPMYSHPSVLWLLHFNLLLCHKHSRVPAKVLSSNLVESQVEWPVKVPELLQYIQGDLGVGAPLGFPQAAWPITALWLFQAGEALGLVEIEVLVAHHPFQTQEILDTAHLSSWV